MNYAEELDKPIGQMEWGDVVDTLNDVISETLTSNPALSNLPPPAVPVFNSHHQPVDYLTEGSVMKTLVELDSGHTAHSCGQTMMAAHQMDSGHVAHSFGQTMMAARQLDSGHTAHSFGQMMMAARQLDSGHTAHSFGQMMMAAHQLDSGHTAHSFGQMMMAARQLDSGHTAHSFGQTMMAARQLDSGHAAHSLGQTMAAPQLDLPYHPTVGNFSGPSIITSSSAAPSPTVVQNLVPVQLVNGQVVFMVMKDGSNSAAPSLDTSVTKKRKSKEQQDDGLPYVKKPPNAFMLFRKEQRPNVVAELNVRDCAAVNKVLGQKWKMLSKEEQAKYYEEAEVERLRHTVNHPGWSTRQNYGKKRKRERRKASTTAEST